MKKPELGNFLKEYRDGLITQTRNIGAWLTILLIWSGNHSLLGKLGLTVFLIIVLPFFVYTEEEEKPDLEDETIDNSELLRERLIKIRQELRQLLNMHGIRSNPAVSDGWILHQISKLVAHK